MSNTVITNYTDLNGPSTKADSSVVVIVNKDGSLSVDQKLLGTLMGSDGSQAAGISVVRVGHEGKPDDATDSDSDDDDKVPHVTLSVDSYYDEPNSIIKYDSGAEMLQSLRIETRENSLVGFQNDHCYTTLTSPSQSLPQRSDSFATFDEPVIEITHTPPPKPIITNQKKITILDQQVIPKGKKVVLNPDNAKTILKGNEASKCSLVLPKSKNVGDSVKDSEGSPKTEESTDSSSITSGDSIPDRDSDSDYRETRDRAASMKVRRAKTKPRILKSSQSTKPGKLEPKVISRLKAGRSIIKKEIKEKIQSKTSVLKKHIDLKVSVPQENSVPTLESLSSPTSDPSKSLTKVTPKPIKKEKKTPAHVTALLSDMTSLFSTPDVIRRVSTDKPIVKSDKEVSSNKKPDPTSPSEINLDKILDNSKKPAKIVPQKTYLKQKDKSVNIPDKVAKSYDLIPQLDDASLAQILQDTTGVTNPVKSQTSTSTANTMNSPSLPGPLSPTLDLLGGLQPEEEGLTEDLLLHVAQLVESSENLQEVIDKQVLGKVDTAPSKTSLPNPYQTPSDLYTQSPSKSVKSIAVPRKDPIEIVRRDGRVITLPPIEAPATRASKRKSQVESTNVVDTVVAPVAVAQDVFPIEPVVQQVSKQYINKKLTNKKLELPPQAPVVEKMSAESQESWNSEDDPNRLWCICKQPHNNRFMICCDSCEDWFHGKCVNITKAMGHQMEQQGIEWRCPNCIKKTKQSPKIGSKVLTQKKLEVHRIPPHALQTQSAIGKSESNTSCIVCKKSARASSIYCSDNCILTHAQDSLGTQNVSPKGENEYGKTQDKQKPESRVIVYERKSGRLLAGPNAPTAENLRMWLQKNPTFEVVRPGTLSTIKPNIMGKKTLSNDRKKIQTTLNFERVPRKMGQMAQSPQTKPKAHEPDVSSPPQRHIKEEVKTPKTPIATKSHHSIFDSPKPSTSTAKAASEPKKAIRVSARSHSTYEKSSASPTTSRRKDPPESRNTVSSGESVRENVRKTLREQLSIRMKENEQGSKLTEEEIRQFANDTEFELHELFRDAGMKYKAKYRSLMFNIKDRKNLTLWQKLCDRSITAKQLVRLSPEELASQELAQWRDKEAKHQLELIKKSELDLLAASKTYVLKTHKGEEVMETKESVSTELDPNVPVEDLVTALNDSGADTTVEAPTNATSTNTRSKHNSEKKNSSGKRKDKQERSSRPKSGRESRPRSESRKSRSSRRKSDAKEERSSHKSARKLSDARATSRDRHKDHKQKSDSTGISRHRSRSRNAHKRSRSRSHSHSRSARSRRRESTRAPPDSHQHRSRSQDNTATKNDSTDSDSVERPKSAMLKEAHPEYDPHEPMITSAFSEEDLRKSREDVYDIKEYAVEADYDTSKAFTLDANIVLSEKEPEKRISEAESDQEPSSTVEGATAAVWNGCINMVDVARFYVAAHEVSGSATDLEEDLSAELDIVGRINPDTVWEYIGKMKRASNKDIIVLRLQAANDEERMQYIALYSYLNSRNRLGVVKVRNTSTVKDFYIVPLSGPSAVPPVLLPLEATTLGDARSRTHLLLAIVIRQRRKRPAPASAAASAVSTAPPPKVARASSPALAASGSYTPPPADPASTAPAAPTAPAYASPALSLSVKDKIAATLASADDEPYSPGSSSSSGSEPAPPGSATTLRTKMEELNRQIEEQKQQILKMARADSSSAPDDEEAYSPSRPLTPPDPPLPSVPSVPLAEIALPSNLQEILATIKQREAPADVDMRLPPPH